MLNGVVLPSLCISRSNVFLTPRAGATGNGHWFWTQPEPRYALNEETGQPMASDVLIYIDTYSERTSFCSSGSLQHRLQDDDFGWQPIPCMRLTVRVG